MPTGVSFVAISAGGSHTCAIAKDTGKAYCWGMNNGGQIGTSPRTTSSKIPIAVATRNNSILVFSAISAGISHTCAIEKDTGVAYCWGRNIDYQLGIGTNVDQYLPTVVSKPADVRILSISAGGFHTCAVAQDTNVAYCWGRNGDFQLGNGSTNAFANVPVAVNMPSNTVFASSEAGSYHTCALTSGGKAYCWGRNSHGQLGDGTVTNSNIPVTVMMP